MRMGFYMWCKLFFLCGLAGCGGVVGGWWSELTVGTCGACRYTSEETFGEEVKEVEG